jgi:hypothetical protein
MSPNMFMFLTASASSVLCLSLSYGVVPTAYAGIVAGVSMFVAGLVKPPAKKS